jgi:hypothetical protein
VAMPTLPAFVNATLSDAPVNPVLFTLNLKSPETSCIPFWLGSFAR